MYDHLSGQALSHGLLKLSPPATCDTPSLWSETNKWYGVVFRCFGTCSMPIGLANILAIFQTYINYILVDLVNIICIIYIDNILIFSSNNADYEQYIYKVLE